MAGIDADFSDFDEAPQAPPRASRVVIPNREAIGGSLLTVVAVMCFLASVALGVTIAVNRLVSTWSTGLTAAVTVQIRPSEAMAPEEQRTRAVALLEGTPGLTEVSVLSRGDTESLLDPWIGTGNLPEDMKLPQLIDVRVDLAARPDLEALAHELAETVPGAALDDHMRWKTRLIALSGSIQLFAFAALTLIVLATVAIIVFATRAVMQANREVVDVLHLIGARDGFIASEFQRHFLRLGLIAGFVGAGLAAGAFFALSQVLGGEAFFIPGFAYGWTSALALLLVPSLAALVAMLTARFTALAKLSRVL